MEDREYRDSLRLNHARRDRLLQRMDASATGGEGRVRRKLDRYAFRHAELPILIVHPGSTMGRFLMCTRNLSSGGLSFLHGGYLHRDTEVRVLLTDRSGRVVPVVGSVVSCRYVSFRVHEVGVQFDKQIRIADFCDPDSLISSRDAERTSVRIPQVCGLAMCVSANADDRERVGRWLTSAGVTTAEANGMGAALDKVKRLPLDLIVLNTPGLDRSAQDAAESLRNAGFKGVLLGAFEDQREFSIETRGMNAKIHLPLSSEEIFELLPGLLGELQGSNGAPIFSSLAMDSGITELLEGYVPEARAAGGRLKEAVVEENIEGAAAACRALSSTAGGYGFAGLQEAATGAMRAIEQAADLAACRGQLDLVISICARLQASRPPISEAA